jgi:hypothetical protein
MKNEGGTRGGKEEEERKKKPINWIDTFRRTFLPFFKMKIDC